MGNDRTEAPVGEVTENATPQAEQPQAAASASGQAAASPDEMRLLLEDARSKADEHWNDLLRAKAETENVRRRAQRDVEKAHKYALERFAAELLPVKDSLELGLSAASETPGDVNKLREGTELTLKMLTAAMEKFGIKELNPLNEPFNPEWHQAMTTQPSSSVVPNTVLTVYQKGYTLNDRLIRPALVIVSRAAAGGGDPDSPA